MEASLEILLKKHFPPISVVSASLFAAWHEYVKRKPSIGVRSARPYN
jgi:hypothetical protein